MNKYLKGAIVFTGGLVSGVTLCGVAAVHAFTKSDDIREYAKDHISKKINYLLYGTYPSTRNRVSYVDYKRYGSNNKPVQEEYVFGSRDEAELAVSHIKEMAEKYGIVSVVDIKYICGIDSSYTDDKYGWTERRIKDAIIVRCRNGYKIDLPRPLPIK